MIEALPQVLNSPENLTARARIQYGALRCGLVLGQVGMRLHHKLRHTLGGSFDLPHAVILLHAIACNEFALPDVLAPIAMLLGAKLRGSGFMPSPKACTRQRRCGPWA